MAEITVQRHGDRWAIHEPGAESPTKEFETREAAEAAARAMGGEVVVREDDPSGLAEDREAAQPEGTPAEGPTGVSGRERARTNQAGL